MTRSLHGLRVAVTGASGFCGGYAARAAADAGADVVCLGRRPGPVGRHVAWDATQATPDLAGADAVIHLAAAVGDPVDSPATEAAFHATNVDGARRLLDAARGRPVVWVSSASVYDPRGESHRVIEHHGVTEHQRVTEEHPIGAQHTAYGRTKAAGERIALDAGAVVLRPRAVYGRGDPYLLPRIRRTSRAGFAILPGRNVKLSLTAVENLADACLAAIGWPGGAYNIADAQPYWRDQAVRDVLAAHGIQVRVVHLPVHAATTMARVARWFTAEPALTPYAIDQVSRSFVLDITKAVRQGWRPRRTLADYLADIARLSECSPPAGG